MGVTTAATRRRVVAGSPASSGPRPSFFIVGAPKCGTSALTAYLKRHPDVFLTRMREPMFFGSDLCCPPRRRLSLERYLSLYATATTEGRLGDCSTRYFVSTRAAEEILRFEPDARIIVMLRNPVEMIHSLHAQNLYSGEEHLEDFAAALADEPRRLALIAEEDPSPIPEALAYRYVARYAEHVGRYLSVFGRDRVHVIVFEEFVRDIPTAYRRVLEFIGADPDFRPEFEVVNQYKVVRSTRLHRLLVRPPRAIHPLRRLASHRLRYKFLAVARELITRYEKRPPVPADVRAGLEDELAPEIDRLEDLLGRDLSAWRMGR